MKITAKDIKYGCSESGTSYGLSREEAILKTIANNIDEQTQELQKLRECIIENNKCKNNSTIDEEPLSYAKMKRRQRKEEIREIYVELMREAKRNEKNSTRKHKITPLPKPKIERMNHNTIEWGQWK